MKYVTPAEYARHRGVDRTSVYRAIERGRISYVMQGCKKMVNIAKADREWEKNTDHTKAHAGRAKYQRLLAEQAAREAVQVPPVSPKPVPLIPSPPPMVMETVPGVNGNGSNHGPNQTQARTILTVYKAQLAKMEVERERGSYLEKKAALRHIFTVVRTMRDHLLTIPDRISAIVASETDIHKVSMLLEKEINQSLEGLADRIANFGDQPGDE